MIGSRLTQSLSWRRPTLAMPPGPRLHSNGDVHCRDELLGELARAIERDCASAPNKVVK
jgi:hypothetical protein